MNITPDTNILLRASIGDDPDQTERAEHILASATTIVLTTTVLCEFVWVLTRTLKRSAADVAASIERLLSAETTISDRAAVEAGLAFLKAGADFADGVIAYQGAQLGGNTFVTFDRQAAAAARARGHTVHEP